MNENKSPSYFRDGGGRGDARTHNTDDTTLKYTHTLYIHIYNISYESRAEITASTET